MFWQALALTTQHPNSFRLLIHDPKIISPASLVRLARNVATANGRMLAFDKMINRIVR